MLQSDLCVLKNLAPEVRKNMGEDPDDVGGYFIVDGKEKVIVSQEKFADNMLYIQKDVNDRVAYSAKSVRFRRCLKTCPYIIRTND